jgi:hypothetical protein
VEGRQPPLDLLGEDGPMRGLRTVLAAGVTALVLTSCAGNGTEPAAAPGSPGAPRLSGPEPARTLSEAPLATDATSGGTSPPSSPAPGTTDATAPAPPAPDRRACYRLAFTDLPRAANDSEPVPCGSRHTTQPSRVGRRDTVVDGHSLSVDSATAEEQMASTCHRRMTAYLGGPVARRHMSRFMVVWFRPTLEQADLGARWFRCDLVALAGGSRLYPLPGPRRLHGVLESSRALRTYGLCGTTAPGSPGFDRVICGRPHRWRAFSTIAIDGGRKYPGQRAVREAGDATCRARAAQLTGFSLKFSYGWEWPTRDQWESGQHYGYCWVPD